MTLNFLHQLKLKGSHIHEMAYKVAILFILLLFSFLLILTAVNSYLMSLNASKNILEGRALSIAVNIRITLEKLGINQEIFPEIIQKDTKGDIAFIALYDVSGNTIMHSNPQMVGRVVDDLELDRLFQSDAPQKGRMKLATGETVFTLDFPISFGDSHKKSENIYILRVALHPSFSMVIARQAFAGMIFVIIGIVILWILVVMVYQNMKKRENLKTLLNERQRLASLGEMASVLAHEIRNPLSSIKGFAQFHLERTVDKTLYEDLRVIVDEASRLERLTSNLLDYSRPLKIFKKNFSIVQLFNTLKRELGEVPNNIKINFDSDIDEIYSDREKFFQIFINLIQNSICALEEKGGEIQIIVTKDNGKINIIVKDDGPGFPNEILEKIFEPFITTKAKGVGLGLAIVKRLVDELGGTIKAENLMDGGAMVSITLPIENNGKTEILS